MSYVENINSENHFSNVANVGDVIKAYHFAPTPDRADSYLIGHVIKKGVCEGGYEAYTVQLVKNVFNGESKSIVGDDIYFVPYETFDDRYYAKHCDVDRVSKVG